MIRVDVVGATGYSGSELVALLDRHSSVEIAALFSGIGGRPASYASLHPALARRNGPGVEPFRLDRLLQTHPDLVFLATPHEISAELTPSILSAGARVIDLSGAFRLPSADSYTEWYRFEHPASELLETAVYGLPEWFAESLSGARLVANPGCYPTSILLALLPLRDLLADDQPIVCDAKSGVSGAGRRQELEYSFAELSNNFRAYGIGRHRHEPEIRHLLGVNGSPPFVFVPHLLPVNRGILSTIYIRFAQPLTEADVASRYSEAYGDAPFVVVHPAGEHPDLKSVVGTPRAGIGFSLLDGGRGAVVVSVLDNLLKGAASQAIQNLNLVFGLDPREGLA